MNLFRLIEYFVVTWSFSSEIIMMDTPQLKRSRESDIAWRDYDTETLSAPLALCEVNHRWILLTKGH